MVWRGIAAALVSVGCGPGAGGGGEGTGSSETSNGSSTTVDCNLGSSGCACTVGGGCDPGLACEGGVCMPEATSTSLPGTTSSSTSDGSSSDASSSSSADSSSTSDTGIPKGCGDDELEPPEECDDGNNASGDGCNADCTLGGQVVWEVTFDGHFAVDDRGGRVAVDADDNVLVVGTALALTQDRDGIVIKLDDDGQFEWDEVFDSEEGTSNDGFWGVAAGPGGEVIVAGHTATDDNTADAFIRCYSSDGEIEWTHVEDVESDGYANEVAVDPDGNVIVLGLQRDPMDGTWQTHVWKFTISGDVIWDEVYPNGIYASPYAMAVDGAGAILYGAGTASRSSASSRPTATRNGCGRASPGRGASRVSPSIRWTTCSSADRSATTRWRLGWRDTPAPTGPSRWTRCGVASSAASRRRSVSPAIPTGVRSR